MYPVAHLGRGGEVAVYKQYKSQQLSFSLEKEITVFFCLQLRTYWCKRRLPCCLKLKLQYHESYDENTLVITIII